MGVTSSVHIHGDDPQHATQGAAEAFVANLNRTVQSVGPNPLLMAAAMDPAFGREMAAAIGEAASAERARRSAAPAEPQTSQPQPIYPPDAQPPTELQAAEPLEVVVRLLPAEPTSQPQANTAEPDAEPHAESQAVEPHTEPQTTAMDELERDAAVKSAAREKAAAEARTAALEAAPGSRTREAAKLRLPWRRRQWLQLGAGPQAESDHLSGTRREADCVQDRRKICCHCETDFFCAPRM
jgi:hypothetical protein